MSESKQNKLVDKNAPVIVGVGDFIDRSKEDGLNLQDLLAKAGRGINVVALAGQNHDVIA